MHLRYTYSYPRSQHDEATTHWTSMTDQTSLGHKFIAEVFGPTALPTIGWQIDPFGHSSLQAHLMGALLGFDAVFLGRTDYQDLAQRKQGRQLELLWRPSPSLGSEGQILASTIYSGNYGPPDGFNFEDFVGDEPIQDDPALAGYNLPARVDLFVNRTLEISARYEGGTRDVFVLLGTDFCYQNAATWFKNIDKLLAGLRADQRLNTFYSTPSAYIAARKTYQDELGADFGGWPLKTDDFFPYLDFIHAPWTGYFSSRPTQKHFIRSASAFLNAARQLDAAHAAWAVRPADHPPPVFPAAPSLADPLVPGPLGLLEEATATAQHHDAITGTAKQHVANDYARRIAAGLTVARPVVYRALQQLSRAYAAGGHPQESASRGEKYFAFWKDFFTAPLRLFSPSRMFSSPSRNDAQSAMPSAAAGSRTAAPQALDYATCPYANVSICAETFRALSDGRPIAVVIYNPLAWAVADLVRLPVPHANLSVVHARQGPSGGARVPQGKGSAAAPHVIVEPVLSQSMPIAQATARLQATYVKCGTFRPPLKFFFREGWTLACPAGHPPKCSF